VFISNFNQVPQRTNSKNTKLPAIFRHKNRNWVLTVLKLYVVVTSVDLGAVYQLFEC